MKHTDSTRDTQRHSAPQPLTPEQLRQVSGGGKRPPGGSGPGPQTN